LKPRSTVTWNLFVSITTCTIIKHVNSSSNLKINVKNCVFTFLDFSSLLSQPHFEGNVRSPLTLPKMGLGSPPGLLKTQSVIAGVKTLRIEVFFIPLERSWSVDVQNGLAWAILDICSTSYGRKKGRESN